MSLDLFEPKTNSFIEGLPRTDSPPPGVFDNFLYGTGMAAMRGFAKTGRAIDLLGSVGPIVQDKIAGNTEASDKYFKEHEEVFQKAVDYWTPKPNEVGIAGEVVGNLVSMLPQVIASPGMAVGSTLLDAAEDLTKAGVSSPKAISVGVTQALGLGAGIWLPILGQTAAQRILLGGAGFNVAQGIATRGISGEILEGTQAEHQYKAFDPTSLTLDVLLGAAFGTMAHLNPAQREQGAEVLGKIKAWAEGLKPSEIDALATLREAEHLNKDSMPGVPKSMEDIDAHVQAMREGLDQIIRDQPVELSNMPKAQFDTDPERVAQAVDQARFLSEEAVKLRDEYGFADPEHITSQARSIGESVTEKLKATGMEPEEATTNGKLWETAFRYFGKEYGVSPQMLFDRYGLDVQRMTELPGGMEQPARIQTDTPEFKAWFGDSKVVDADGKPLVVYHGTKEDFDTFHPESHFGTKEQADTRLDDLKGRTGKNVMPAYLSLQKVKRVKDVEIAANWRAEVKKAKRQGYDGIVYKNEFEGNGTQDSFIAFSPTQIKSAIGNRGTFDPNDPNILHQSQQTDSLHQGNRGAIQFNEGKTLIGMFGAADKSTFAHESSHAFLEMIRSIATHPDAPSRAKADYELLKRNLGFDGDTIPREAHEAFAGMNEQYLMEGNAPSKELAPVFERFKAWLLDVYKSVESIIGPRLNTEVRSFLDNLYGQEARTETETPLAKTSPPPPPGEVQPAGDSAQKPSQAEEKTILAKTAERLATERGEETITIGQDAEGNPVKQTVKQFLDGARAEVDQAKEDVSLFEMAASCLLKSL